MKESKIIITPKFDKDKVNDWPYYDIWQFEEIEDDGAMDYFNGYWEDEWLPSHDSDNPIYEYELTCQDELLNSMNGLDRAAKITVRKNNGISRRFKEGN